LGRDAIRLERGEGSILMRSARQRRAPGVSPCREPEGSDVGGGVGELANQNGSGLIVEAFKIVIGKEILAAACIAIGHENRLQPAMRGKAGLESAIRGVADESCVVRTHRKKRGEAVDQRSAEAFIDSRLPAEAPIK